MHSKLDEWSIGYKIGYLKQAIVKIKSDITKAKIDKKK